jgi:non-specific protein-tyrosine kinase
VNTDATRESDLQAALKVIWRRKLVFLELLLIGPALAFYLSSRSEKIYESSTVLQIQPLNIDNIIAGNGSEEASAQTVATVARLVTTTGVAQEAAKRLKPRPVSPRALVGQVSVTQDATAGFITITVSDPDPQRAADVANAFGKALGVKRAQEARIRLSQAIDQLNAQRDATGGGDQFGTTVTPQEQERQQLSTQIARLRALRGAQDGNAQVVETALPSASPVSPHPRRDTVLGFIISLFVATGLVLVLENLDRRIRRAEELEELTLLPLLAGIPKSAFPDEENQSQDVEAFHTLRASLTAFNAGRDIKSVLICGAGEGDGKTTVAVRLALAYAQEGKSVILVDADMRRPQAAQRLGLHSAPGLAELLQAKTELGQALQRYPVATVGAGGLRVIAGGAPPNAPSELLSSANMARLLGALGSLADIVIVDTNPILRVGDAIPLLKLVSGVVVVGRIDHTKRAAFARLQQTITSAHGTILGVVATGMRGRHLYGYETQYAASAQAPPAGPPAALAEVRPPSASRSAH